MIILQQRPVRLPAVYLLDVVVQRSGLRRGVDLPPFGALLRARLRRPSLTRVRWGRAPCSGKPAPVRCLKAMNPKKQGAFDPSNFEDADPVAVGGYTIQGGTTRSGRRPPSSR